MRLYAYCWSFYAWTMLSHIQPFFLWLPWVKLDFPIVSLGKPIGDCLSGSSYKPNAFFDVQVSVSKQWKQCFLLWWFFYIFYIFLCYLTHTYRTFLLSGFYYSLWLLIAWLALISFFSFSSVSNVSDFTSCVLCSSIVALVVLVLLISVK